MAKTEAQGWTQDAWGLSASTCISLCPRASHCLPLLGLSFPILNMELIPAGPLCGLKWNLLKDGPGRLRR